MGGLTRLLMHPSIHRCMGVDPKFEGPAVLRADRAAAAVGQSAFLIVVSIASHVS